MRDLTVAQRSRLDAEATKDPGATIVGWERQGPIIQFSDGRRRRLNPVGRLTKALTQQPAGAR